MQPIRLVHIADLHAGKTYDKRLNRNEDLLYALEQIENFIRENKTDFLIVAGDIFDKKIPDTESLELISEFFVRVSELGTEIVAIGGNHDSEKFLSSLLPWTKKYRVKLFPKFDRKNFVYSKGDIAFVAIPFISERAITELSEGEEKAKLEYAELMKKLLKFAAKNVENFKYKVLISHLFFANSKIGKSEVEITVSDAYAVPQAAIPDTFDYVALGHVHRYQRLEYAPTEAYYCGSLYQLDFGESGQGKYFNSVVLEDKSVKVEKIQLSLKRRLEKVVISKGSNLEKLKEFRNNNVYLWVEVEAETPQEFLVIKDKVEKLLEERLLKITPKGLRKQRETKPAGEKLKLENPVEVYKAYFKTLGKNWNSSIEKYLRRILQEV